MTPVQSSRRGGPRSWSGPPLRVRDRPAEPGRDALPLHRPLAPVAACTDRCYRVVGADR